MDLKPKPHFSCRRVGLCLFSHLAETSQFFIQESCSEILISVQEDKVCMIGNRSPLKNVKAVFGSLARGREVIKGDDAHYVRERSPHN